MFRNVLVGVDGRVGGQDAISLASRLLAADGELTLAHVHNGGLRPPHAYSQDLLDAELKGAQQLLEQERAAADVQAQLVTFACGSPGRGLHLLAEQRAADLLVVGSCSRGAFGRAMLGDDTKASLNGAPCAVAIAVKGYAEHPVPLASVGVGYDGSQKSQVALVTARALASQYRSSIQALEVIAIPTYAFAGVVPSALGEDIELMLGQARERLSRLEDVHGRAVYGFPGGELATFSREVELLIVGSRGYGPMRRLMLGSTSEYLERHAHCSLVVVPRGVSGASGNGAEQITVASLPEHSRT
jgi:nucleotide-binding universal stress UspA family protein